MNHFDGPNLIITLPSGQTSISAEKIYSDWKSWARESDNSKYLSAFRVVGGDPLTAGIDAGSYFFLRNDYGWRIKPPEEHINIFLAGNLVPEDFEQDILLPTDGYFTTAIFGLQPITQSVDTLFELQKITDYMGMIYIDTSPGFGQSGTSHPVGTASFPVSNLTDALIIREKLNINAFMLRDSVVFTENMPRMEWVGIGSQATVDINGASLNGSEFTDLTVTGDFSGAAADPPVFKNCRILNGQSVHGIFVNCTFSGNNSLGAGFMAMNNCGTDAAGLGNRVLDFAGNTMQIVALSNQGRFELRNMTAPGSGATFNLNNGAITLAPSCTSGSTFISGVGTIVDDSTGTFVNKENLFEVDAVSNGLSAIFRTLISEDVLIQPDSTATIIKTTLTQPDNFYNGQIAVVLGSAGSVARAITSYSDGDFVLDLPLPFTPTTTDRLVVLNQAASAAASVDTDAVALAVWATNSNANTDEQSMLAKLRRNLPR